MHRNQHKRLARRVVPRFEPTWLGQDPAAVTSTAAVLPPVATTPDPAPVQTTPAVPTPAPVETTPVQVTTAPAPTTPTTSQVTEQPTTSVTPTSSAELTTSSTSTTTSSSSSALVPTTSAEQTTARVASNSAAQATTQIPSRTVASFTNSQGGVVYTTVVGAAPTSASPSATATPTSSNAGTIVGAVAGAFVGIVCLIAFVSWIVRQHNKRKAGNHDDFDRQSYLRNSTMIPDEPAGHPVIGSQAALTLARNNTVAPRPPTMIERKPTFLMHNGQPSPSFQPGQVISFEPGQIVSAPQTATGEGAYPSPMAFAAYTPPAQHHQSELSRRPSGAKLLTRQPTNGGVHDAASYAHTPSPGGYGPEAYHVQSPESYPYTYPMHLDAPAPERDMVLSVTPFQAQQYAELSRALEGPDQGNESFHPMSRASPAGDASEPGSPAPSSLDPHAEKVLPNPFEDQPAASSQRIDSTPPSLPPIGSPSRTGTPIDPNPQHAHWSYDDKGQAGGNRLSVAGMPAPIAEAPAMPPAAHTREERTIVVGNGEELKGQRPISYVDNDDAYGGM